MDRETAWQILTEHVKEKNLRRHMVAVEAATRWYAGGWRATHVPGCRWMLRPGLTARRKCC